MMMRRVTLRQTCLWLWSHSPPGVLPRTHAHTHSRPWTDVVTTNLAGWTNSGGASESRFTGFAGGIPSRPYCNSMDSCASGWKEGYIRKRKKITLGYRDKKMKVFILLGLSLLLGQGRPQATEPIEPVHSNVLDDGQPGSALWANTTARPPIAVIAAPFSVTVPDCGRNRFTAKEFERIVGGHPAITGQFPWQVYLRVTTRQGEMLCGGSILNSNWILTAAHCVSSEQTGNYIATKIEVIAGTLTRTVAFDPNRQSRSADCVFKHPGWTGVRGGFANDIALIRLPSTKPLNLNYKVNNVNGVCLPPKMPTPFDYTGWGRVAGWGLTRDRGVPSRNLQYADVNIISDRDCRRYSNPVDIVDSMACQGVEPGSPCQGDSGGPLIIRANLADRPGTRYVQFGLVSFGPGICNNGRIPNAVYTQVSHHLAWIENTVRAYQGSASCTPRSIETH